MLHSAIVVLAEFARSLLQKLRLLKGFERSLVLALDDAVDCHGLVYLETDIRLSV